MATWQRRFAEHGPDGLLDAPRPGAPRTLDDRAVERLITLTLETQPDHATRWSTRSMAEGEDEPVRGQPHLARLRAGPHRHEAWKLSTDPLFVDKVRDIVGLYISPRDHALVLTRSSG